MAKEYEYYVSYSGSGNSCFRVNVGRVLLPTPIVTLADIESVENLIMKVTGQTIIRHKGRDRPALLGFHLLQTREVEKPEKWDSLVPRR